MTRFEANCSAAQLATAADWCVQLAEGTVEPAQREDFQCWIEAHSGNRAAFEEVAATWHAVEACGSTPRMVAWRRAALAAGQRTRRWHTARLWLRPSRSAAIAASVAVAIAGSVLWVAMRVPVLATELGERRVATLVDGSRVSMDAATQLTVLYTKDQRRVHLESGRARFDVAKNALRPFSVEAGGRTIIATGTSFSVEVLHRQIRVVLYEGHVIVAEPRKRPQAEVHEIELSAGRTLICEDGQPARDLVNSGQARSLSWEGGLVAFDDEPLDTAVERINRYSVRKVAIGDPDIAALRISGLFEAGNVDAFVEGVTGALSVRAQHSGTQIELVHAVQGTGGAATP